MALPDWSPVRSPSGQSPETNGGRLDRENAALRELVTVYRYLSGLALQEYNGVTGGTRGHFHAGTASGQPTS